MTKSPRGSDCPVCGKHYEKYNSMTVHRIRTHLPGPAGGIPDGKSGNSLTRHRGPRRGIEHLPDWYFKPSTATVPELWKWLVSLEEGMASEELIAHFIKETGDRMCDLVDIMEGNQSDDDLRRREGRELTPQENVEFENLIDHDDFLRGKVMRQGNPFYHPWLARVVKELYWGREHAVQ